MRQRRECNPQFRPLWRQPATMIQGTSMMACGPLNIEAWHQWVGYGEVRRNKEYRPSGEAELFNAQR